MNFYDKIVRPTTQMLLKRMETNPEDFDLLNEGMFFGSRSWLAVVKQGEFNFVERKLIHRKVVAIRRKDTEQRILELLLDGQAKQEPWEFTNSNVLAANVTVNTNGVTAFNTTQRQETWGEMTEKRVVFSQAGLIGLQQTNPQKFAKIKKAHEEYKAQKEE